MKDFPLVFGFLFFLLIFFPHILWRRRRSIHILLIYIHTYETQRVYMSQQQNGIQVVRLLSIHLWVHDFLLGMLE